jgi:hypothetical protein
MVQVKKKEQEPSSQDAMQVVDYYETYKSFCQTKKTFGA